METSGFLSYTEVEHFLDSSRLEIKEIVLELRNLVNRTCPYASERILWGGLSYHDPNKGGPVKGAICQIEVDESCVRISFIHGVRLKDPHGLLVGDRLSKRHVVIDSYEEAPWDEITELIEEAAGLDPTTFGPI
jgi:hypothetical protein